MTYTTGPRSADASPHYPTPRSSRPAPLIALVPEASIKSKYTLA
jgi:hypothetical protein